MSVEIDLGNPPAGYAVSSALAGVKEIPVQYMEFTSSEDGQHFIKRLEGLPNKILDKLPLALKPSLVDHLLVIARRDGKATVYVNELEMTAHVRASSPITAGANVKKTIL